MFENSFLLYLSAKLLTVFRCKQRHAQQPLNQNFIQSIENVSFPKQEAISTLLKEATSQFLQFHQDIAEIMKKQDTNLLQNASVQFMILKLKYSREENVLLKKQNEQYESRCQKWTKQNQKYIRQADQKMQELTERNQKYLRQTDQRMQELNKQTELTQKLIESYHKKVTVNICVKMLLVLLLVYLIWIAFDSRTLDCQKCPLKAERPHYILPSQTANQKSKWIYANNSSLLLPPPQEPDFPHEND